jgi:hypothetical protein
VSGFIETDRGFLHANPIPVLYGFGHVRVFESSLATKPAVWLDIVESDDHNSRDPAGPTHRATCGTG